jgi:hypothetical protein
MTPLETLVRSSDRHAELPLGDLVRYPVLAACVAAWRTAPRRGALPAALPVDRVPAEARPYTMLLDYLPAARDARVRFAGNYVGERARFDIVGRTLRGYFAEEDARIVFDGLALAAGTRAPTLARRDYVSIDGQRCRYVRLILPLASDGATVDGFFKTVEPSTLEIRPLEAGT